jgi:hypothetical protein
MTENWHDLECLLKEAVTAAEIAVAMLGVQGVDDPMVVLSVCTAEEKAMKALEAMYQMQKGMKVVKAVA